GRQRAGRSCAETPRCRAAAKPDRPGFRRVAAGVVAYWSLLWSFCCAPAVRPAFAASGGSAGMLSKEAQTSCSAPVEESLRNPRPIGSQIRPFVCQFGWYAIRMADQKAPQEASLFPVKASPASVTTPQNGRIGSLFRNISGVAPPAQALALPVSAVRSLRSA